MKHIISQINEIDCPGGVSAGRLDKEIINWNNFKQKLFSNLKFKASYYVK